MKVTLNSKPKDVYHLQLISGQDVFGPVTESPTHINVEEPLLMEFVEQGSIFTRFLPHAEPKDNFASIPINCVVAKNVVNAEMRKYYNLNKFFVEEGYKRDVAMIQNQNMKLADTISTHEESDGKAIHVNHVALN